MNALNWFKVGTQKLLSMMGFLFLMLADSLLAMIVAPSIWPGLRDFSVNLFGVIPIDLNVLSFTIGFSLSAIQRALIRNSMPKFDRWRNGGSFFDNDLDKIKWAAALAVSLFDSFVIDAQVGFLADSGSWGWIWFFFFGTFSLIGEPLAEYIWENEFTPKNPMPPAHSQPLSRPAFSTHP